MWHLKSFSTVKGGEPLRRIKQIAVLLVLMLFWISPFYQIPVEAITKPGTVTGLKRDPAHSEIVWWKDVVGSGNDIYYQVQCANSKNGSYKLVGETTNSTYDFSRHFTKMNNILYIKVRAYKALSNGTRIYGNYSKAFEIVRAPKSKVNGLRQSKQTRNSVTLTWKKTSGANGYFLQYAHCWKASGSASGKVKQVDIGNKTTYTLKNLDNSYCYKVKIIPYYRSGSGIYGTGVVSDGLMVKLVPDQANKLEKIFSLLENTSYVDGYQVQISNLDTGKIVFDKTMTEVMPILPTLSKNVFYKGKVRAYVTVNGQKIYGQWSYYQYSARMDLIYPKVADGKTTFRWSKVRGASGYYVCYNKDGKSGSTKTAGTSVSYKSTGKQFSAYVIPYANVKGTVHKGIVYY